MAPPPQPGPRAAVAGSVHPVPAHAVAECAGALIERGMSCADALLVICSPPFAGAMCEITTTLAEVLGCGQHLGVVGESVVLGGRLAEGTPALGVLAVRDADARVASLGESSSYVGADATATAVVLWDPFSASEDVVAGCGLQGSVVGGALAASSTAGGNRLVVNGVENRNGAAVLAIGHRGDAVVVSDGCAPMAAPIAVTAVSGTSITALGDMPAAEWLEAAAGSADTGLVDGAVELGLRRCDPRGGATAPMVPVRRTTSGLQPAVDFEVGAVVQPVVRSAAAAQRELPELLGDAGTHEAILTLWDPARPRGVDPHAEAALLAEASLGDDIGLACGAVVHLEGHAGRGAAAMLCISA